jgi:AcrR family transcriptional regulator
MITFTNAEPMQKKIALRFMEIAKEKNYRKISISEIMQPLNVTRQSFYYYFTDIDELIG